MSCQLSSLLMCDPGGVALSSCQQTGRYVDMRFTGWNRKVRFNVKKTQTGIHSRASHKQQCFTLPRNRRSFHPLPSTSLEASILSHGSFHEPPPQVGTPLEFEAAASICSSTCGFQDLTNSCASLGPTRLHNMVMLTLKATYNTYLILLSIRYSSLSDAQNFRPIKLVLLRSNSELQIINFRSEKESAFLCSPIVQTPTRQILI